MWGQIAGAAISGLAGAYGAKKSADAAEAAAEMAKPMDYSSPLGTFKFFDGQAESELSGPFNEILQRFQSEAQQDPIVRAQQELAILQQISDPKQAETRRLAREQLYSQGRLGTSAGIRELGVMEEGMQVANLQQQLAAMGRADTLQQQAFSNALGLAQAPNTLANVGMMPVQAGMQQAIGAQQAAGSTLGGAYSAFGQGLGSAVGGIDFSKMFGGGGSSNVGSQYQYGSNLPGQYYSPF